MVDHVAGWSRGFPMLFVCVARPELLETRPGWAGGKLHTTTVLLAPLSGDLVIELIANLLGEDSSAGAISDRIAASAEGNPLFVEEFVAMLVDDGHLKQENGKWIAVDELDRVPVPSTIRSLLAARINGLVAAERGVMERASVIGQTVLAWSHHGPPTAGSARRGRTVSYRIGTQGPRSSRSLRLRRRRRLPIPASADSGRSL